MTHLMYRGTLLLGLLVSPCSSLPAGDRVEALPGWEGALFSRTYSGYIPIGYEDGLQMYEHYMFFESEGDPQDDPLIMWTNGGPGASSLFGAFTELGPYYLSDASLQTEAFNTSGVPSLFENFWRWTKLGSLLVRNMPPPVGFSYCDPAGPSGDSFSCGSWNDTKTAKHSLKFLQGWFEAFPEFADHQFFLAGESYAGIYVPTLAREILEAGPAWGGPVLQGIAIGDGCLGSDNGGCFPHAGPLFDVQFFHGHGQFSDSTYRSIRATCSEHELFNGVQTEECRAVLDRMDEERGDSFAYNLYEECYDHEIGSLAWHEARRFWTAARPNRRLTTDDPHRMDGAPCGGEHVLDKWAGSPAVRRALHVPENSTFFSADGAGWPYNMTEPDLRPWYSKVLTGNSGLRVLIYNGDTDPCVNMFYAENWTASLGFAEREPWRPWTRDGFQKVAGSVTRYEHNFDFLTIRGAGHMVPEYKPEATFVFMRAWLRGEDFPRMAAAPTTSPAPSDDHKTPKGITRATVVIIIMMVLCLVLAASVVLLFQCRKTSGEVRQNLGTSLAPMQD